MKLHELLQALEALGYPKPQLVKQFVSSGGVTYFSQLSDTPQGYKGMAEYFLRVSGDELSIEFFDIESVYQKKLKSIETSTTDATISDTVDVHICNGTSDYTLTLPTATTGKAITIINKNTATITLLGTISSISATSVLYSGESLELVYDGTEWI